MNLMSTIKNLRAINEDNAIKKEIELAEIFSRAQMQKAIAIARKSSGNYDKAYNEIEKIKKGLGDEHIVQNALKKANESVETDLDALSEEELREDYFNVQYYDKNGKAVKGGKTFKTKAEADKYAKRGNDIDKVGGTYKVLAVKGRMESVDLDALFEEELKDEVELDEVNNGLGSFVSQMKKLLKDPKAKKAHKAASSLIMRAQEKGALAKTAVSAIKKALPGLAKKAGGKWEKKILGMKTMLIESVELEEAKVSLEKGDGYEVYTSGKTSAGVMLFLSYKGKIIASGSKKDGEFVFGFKHSDVNSNPKFQPAGMVKKGRDFTHIGFKTAKDLISYAKKQGITEDIKLDEVKR